eukprot:SAG22_NODE_98_length_20720_cov_17.226662_2_plen_1113_part_00
MVLALRAPPLLVAAALLLQLQQPRAAATQVGAAAAAAPPPPEPKIASGLRTTNLFWPGDSDADGTVFACTYIPTLVLANETTLIAHGACSTRPECCNGLHASGLPRRACGNPIYDGTICQKQSRDGGSTWSQLRLVAGNQTATGPMRTIGVQTGMIVYDRISNHLIAHCNTVNLAPSRPQGVSVNDAVELRSSDLGESWQIGKNLSSGGGLLKQTGGYRLFTGPGAALQLSATHKHHPNRLLFAGAITFKNQQSGMSVWFSDDHGESYSLALNASGQPMMVGGGVSGETALAETPDGGVITSSRNTLYHGKNKCNCRAMTRSTDGGNTFGPVYPDPDLPEPECEGTMISVPSLSGARGTTIFHVNAGHGTPGESKSPPDGRASGTVRRSVDGGRHWIASLDLNGDNAYSCEQRYLNCFITTCVVASLTDQTARSLGPARLLTAVCCIVLVSSDSCASAVPQSGFIGLAWETVLPGSGMPAKASANNVVFTLIPQNFTNNSTDQILKTDDDSIDEDLRWVDRPQSWHQQAVRILDHQFSTFAELKRFATDAKRAGVSVVQLVGVQKRQQCPGPWYGGLQLCDHINGSYPAMDGSLAEWQAMVHDLKPLRFMWWTNLAYWSAQGPVFKQALADPENGVGRFFSWADTPSALPLCAGRYSQAPQASGFSNPCGKDSKGQQRCAQGSWGSLESSASADANFSACGCYPGYPGKCISSALANLGHREYFDYLVDALANSWSRNLAISGFFIDTSMQVPCMPGLDPHFSAPNGSETLFFRGIIGKVRETQPQIVVSGEDWGSWDDVIGRNAQLGGAKGGFAAATRQAVLDKDLSKIEPLVSSTDGAVLTCYLHPGLDGQQPGGCPTLSHRDTGSPMRSLKEYRMWVAVEAATGIISELQVKTCGVWDTPQMGADPSGESESPLWAFETNRELNRLALRTKLPITGAGALAYLKHDSMGFGRAAIVIFNPGQAQTLSIDLSRLPPSLLVGSVRPYDLFGGDNATAALREVWSVPMRSGEMKAFAGFSLGVFAPRKGKKAECKPDDGFLQKAARNTTTLQDCFLECQKDKRCENVFIDHVDVGWLKTVPPIVCTLLGVVAEPMRACKSGTGTLVKKMVQR